MMDCNQSAQKQTRTRKLGLRWNSPWMSGAPGEALSTDYYHHHHFEISGHLLVMGNQIGNRIMQVSGLHTPSLLGVGVVLTISNYKHWFVPKKEASPVLHAVTFSFSWRSTLGCPAPSQLPSTLWLNLRNTGPIHHPLQVSERNKPDWNEGTGWYHLKMKNKPCLFSCYLKIQEHTSCLPCPHSCRCLGPL